jgi:hypothetical protein
MGLGSLQRFGARLRFAARSTEVTLCDFAATVLVVREVPQPDRSGAGQQRKTTRHA